MLLKLVLKWAIFLKELKKGTTIKHKPPPLHPPYPDKRNVTASTPVYLYVLYIKH